MSALRRFAGDEAGSPTVEFVMWLPVFVLCLALITNASFLMFEQSKMMDVARQAARLVATGSMNEAAAEAYMRSELGSARSYNVDVTDGGSGGRVRSEITVPAGDIVLFGSTVVGAIFSNGQLAAEVVFLNET